MTACIGSIPELPVVSGFCIFCTRKISIHGAAGLDRTPGITASFARTEPKSV
ncbi:hypothetical protein SNOG_07308 [Parastagonospora nodorum SN15]|uniref:Uncharacterized protein n=1 Tax=Phaeosphaeria nodorum (strain SN15 / ATCC MYA-4574 / FGSC 10173) TaxID=321614 RepID=Q0ULQ6_PHANO|nr:hypothetical protein SNOG_07308 [Parastagonospora nodorum SN15]EAT84774.1 hypothetical protein SNOG_07308 [Parastagonospora nodorum SN15]